MKILKSKVLKIQSSKNLKGLIKNFSQQHLKSKFGQGPALEIQVGDEDVNKVHDLAMEMIPGLTMKDKFQGRYPRSDFS